MNQHFSSRAPVLVETLHRADPPFYQRSSRRIKNIGILQQAKARRGLKHRDIGRDNNSREN